MCPWLNLVQEFFICMLSGFGKEAFARGRNVRKQRGLGGYHLEVLANGAV